MLTKNELKIKKIEGMEGFYEVMEDIEYYNGLIVPKSFITNLASIPEVFQCIIGKPDDEVFVAPSILHDFLYSKYNDYGINRLTADNIFFQSLRMNGCDLVRARLMYRAVRTAGGFHWDKKIFTEEPYEKKAVVDHTIEHKEYQNRMKNLLGEFYV